MTLAMNAIEKAGVVRTAGPVLDAVVSGKAVESEGVVSLTLRAANDAALPDWAPGAHVDLAIEGCATRQYSLMGDPSDLGCYTIGVLREAEREGTSRYIHDRLRVGSALRISPPRNHFPLHDARFYIFIAGGIGITPLLPMMVAAEQRGRGWSLLYGGRTRASMAFAARLAPHAARVQIWPQDERGLPNLDDVLGTPREDTLVYCCGPEGLLLAVQQRCANWPVGSLHVERFSAAPDAASGEQRAFEVVVRSSGLSLPVPPGRSILAVLEQAGIAVPCSCEEGVCGSCETGVVEGIPDHRDAVLSPSERARNDCMMVCVSRSRTPRLVLDL